MRIAQVAPLHESVPPARYGGTERIVSYLTEELVRQGHDVTLFASGDSKTRARLISSCRRSLRLDPESRDPLACHIVLLEEVAQRESQFDIIHFHSDVLHLSLSRRLKTPSVTTLHGRLDLPDLPALFRTFSELPMISISNAQRKPLPQANWIGTVYHGLPRNLYTPDASPECYLAFVGRISPEKGVDSAIEIARRAGMTLRIAAKVDNADAEYFRAHIKPLLSGPGIEFMQEVDDQQKQQLLGKAAALLFPIDWPEPFGIVMIEAMACGTPVIAFPRGSVPEVIEPGVSGVIAENIDQAVEAVHQVATLPRRRARESFEQRFTSSRMARDYVELYKSVILDGAQAAFVGDEVRQCK